MSVRRNAYSAANINLYGFSNAFPFVDYMGVPFHHVGWYALPTIFASALGGQVAKFLDSQGTKRLNIPPLRMRRLLVFGSFSVAGFFLLCTAATSVPMFAASYITIIFVCIGVASTSYECNYIELAPTHTGWLFGVGNTLATLPGALGPPLVSAVLYNGLHFSLIYVLMALGIVTAGVLFNRHASIQAINTKQPCIQV